MTNADTSPSRPNPSAKGSKKPNVVYFLVDNLGMGELSSYNGCSLRGAKTARTDAFAEQGMMLFNFAPETQCTPSRSALMTGRYSIRSGNHTVAMPGSEGGLVKWERTLFGVKWRNFKMVLVQQKTLSDPALHLTTPHLINLDVDPKEREPYDFPYVHTWTIAHTGKLIAEYQRSLGREPLIPAGAPLDYLPTTKGQR